MPELDIFVTEKSTDHFWATYRLKSKTTLRQAAYELAVGQSIGNPNARSTWETPEMIQKYCAKVLFQDLSGVPISGLGKEGRVQIGFPYAIIDWDADGVSQLLCILMGGQMDIGNIEQCWLLDIDLDPSRAGFQGPLHGLTGFRSLVKSYNKPLFGGIIKPKTGITPDQLLDMVKQLVDGGVDFIKEDEILGDPEICPFEKRVDVIAKYLDGLPKNVVYTACVNGDYLHLDQKVNLVDEKNLDCLGVHANVWSGLGTYRVIRENYRVFQHYQKSGDKVFTNPDHNYHIRWNVLCKLAGWCGVDTIHAGMYGGYLSDTEHDLSVVLKTLRDLNVCPALSCGMTAELIPVIVEKFGVDWMANVGGAIHADPEGTAAGALKIRKAIDSL